METGRNCCGRIFAPFAATTYPLLSAGYSKVAITFLGGMRNISVGAVVAVSYIPAKAAVPVVIGMLFQQILTSTYRHIVEHYYQKQTNLPEKMAS